MLRLHTYTGVTYGILIQYRELPFVELIYTIP